MVARKGPLGKMCKKCIADQKQKNVKKDIWSVRVARVLQEVTGFTANGGF